MNDCCNAAAVQWNPTRRLSSRGVVSIAAAAAVACLALSHAATAIPPTDGADRSDVAEVIHRVARDLPFFEHGPFTSRWVYKLNAGGREDASIDLYNELMQALYDSADNAPLAAVHDVIDLWKDDDPRVRAAAVMWMYQRFDRMLLPLIAASVDDRGKAFPVPLAHGGLSNPAYPPPTPPISGIGTVGGIARVAIAPYVHADDFDTYWEARKDRSHCLSWASVHLAAMRGRKPSFDVRTALQYIDGLEGLSPLEREVYRLALLARHHSWQQAPQGMQMQILSRIGPDRLLALLHREAVIDDPDLPRFIESIADVVLPLAAEIFTSEHAARLAELGPSLRPYTHRAARCYMAAARVDPANASMYIREGLELVEGPSGGYQRAELMRTLWELAGPAEAEFIIDWYVSENDVRNSHPGPHEMFLRPFVPPLSEAQRTLLESLSKEPRFNPIGARPRQAVLKRLRDDRAR